MRSSSMLFAALFLTVLASPGASAGTCTISTNLVSNCGFETGSFTSWTLTGNDTPGGLNNLYGVEGTDPFPTPTGTAPNSGSYQAFFADQFADPTTLSQTLATTAGVSYTISFYMAQQLVGPGTVHNSLVLSFGGNTLTTLTNVGAQGYTLYTTTAVASSSSSVLSLRLGNDVGEFLIDDIGVNAPEPGSWLTVGSGVGLVGWWRRRRSAV